MAGRAGAGADGPGGDCGASSALPEDDRAPLFRASSAALSRSGAAALPGPRLDRLHPRALPETIEGDSRGEGLLMAEPGSGELSLDLLVERLSSEPRPLGRRQLLLG